MHSEPNDSRRFENQRNDLSDAPFPSQSFLFVPGSRPERFDRALSSGADAVIIDLEDAVEPAAKEAAHEHITNWVSYKHPVLVRINGRTTPWFAQDAKLGALDGVAGIVLPKAEQAEDIVATVSIAGRRVPIFPLIESALGLWNALEIAKAPNVARLMFGTLDFIAELGMEDDGAPLNHYRAQLALVSRVAGIEAPVDGVTPDIHDSCRLERDTLNGKRQGFGAKLCIHPTQIETVHRYYRPTSQELHWAARVVEAAASSQAGAFTLDGKMIDKPVLLRARQLLALDNAVKRGKKPRTEPIV